MHSWRFQKPFGNIIRFVACSYLTFLTHLYWCTDNHRPISLLPAISKVFEKVVFEQTYDYFNKHQLSQYGFRKKHSTELALELTDHVTDFLDSGKLPISIFLDLSKAFDTLDHSILLHKLKYYGLDSIPLNWFKSYLEDRFQFVDYDGTNHYFNYNRCTSRIHFRTFVIHNIHKRHPWSDRKF